MSTEESYAEESYATAYFGTANGITAFAVAQMTLVMVSVGSVSDFHENIHNNPVPVMVWTVVMTAAYLSGVIACHHVGKHLLKQVSDQLARRLRWTFWILTVVIFLFSASGIAVLVCAVDDRVLWC